MKFYDLIEESERLNDNGAAYSRQAALLKIIGLDEPIAEYIIKLLTYKDDPLKLHWIEELANWLQQISGLKVKPTGKTLTVEKYFELLYQNLFEGEEEERIKTLLSQLQKDYPGVAQHIPPGLQAKVEILFKLICENLPEYQEKEFFKSLIENYLL